MVVRAYRRTTVFRYIITVLGGTNRIVATVIMRDSVKSINQQRSTTLMGLTIIMKMARIDHSTPNSGSQLSNKRHKTKLNLVAVNRIRKMGSLNSSIRTLLQMCSLDDPNLRIIKKSI